ncbi:hypothetical protein [Mycolicibacterium sp. BK634]|uniref:hypothetical protein n=1 Tax=Mycolicibacterium sp. BK634 TaxID=2587099 RepID=UPI001C84FD37|nr:hypothetical protein [Mycolicibacterium sp. BK634]
MNPADSFWLGHTVVYTLGLWVLCAVVGAAISKNWKNRAVAEGLVLGGLLGILGVAIAACLPKQLPPAPPGMIAVQCPRCNAVQNVPMGQPQYQCWQCHTSTPTPGSYLEFDALANREAARQTSATRKVRCFNCKTVQTVPDLPMAHCSECGSVMKLADRKAPPQSAPTRTVRCFNCKSVQAVPDLPMADCTECGSVMKLSNR